MAAKKKKTNDDPAANVQFVRIEVQDLLSRWNLIRDCVAGAEQVKKARAKYLPRPDPTNTDEENLARYEAYLCRAIFYNVTGRTLIGLVGQVFNKEPVVTVPAPLEILQEDVDGGGVELNQQSQAALSEVIQFGRCGLLVDYPNVSKDAPATIADVQAGKIRPTISLYQPWDIINWRVLTIGGQKLLSLVVLSEKAVTDDDGFEECTQAQYRVLRLNEQGNYQVEVWISDPNANDATFQPDPTQTYVPTNGKGQPWKYIPFTFIGAKNNDPTPDLPPLFDLADLNMGHYRNSADYEEACYMVGQPTLVATGLTKDWVATVLKGSLRLGSRGNLPLPAGASAALLQVAPNTMPMEAMRHKEEQMKAIGAKLLEPGGVQKTATEAGIESKTENSILATCANNVSKAYTACLKWANEFLNIEDDTTDFQLNTDFEQALTAADIPNIIAAWQGQAIAKEEMRDALKSTGLAYLDDSEFDDAISSAGPNMGLPVDPNQQKIDEANALAAAADAKSKVHAANNPPPVPTK